MTSKKYIVSKIIELAKNFPHVKFSYQLDELSETHFIEVLPKDFFDQYNEHFVTEQNNIILDFIKKFPEEGLAFITEDDLFTVNHPEYIKYGNKYKRLIPNLSWNHKNLDRLLTDYSVDIPHSIVFDQEFMEVKQNAIDCKFSFEEKFDQAEFQLLTNNLPSTAMTDVAMIENFSGEQNYSLAA